MFKCGKLSLADTHTPSECFLASMSARASDTSMGWVTLNAGIHFVSLLPITSHVTTAKYLQFRIANESITRKSSQLCYSRYGCIRESKTAPDYSSSALQPWLVPQSDFGSLRENRNCNGHRMQVAEPDICTSTSLMQPCSVSYLAFWQFISIADASRDIVIPSLSSGIRLLCQVPEIDWEIDQYQPRE